MNDTISRAAAKQAVHDTIVSASTVARVWDMIDQIPAVDAAPVIHARWIGYPECLGYDGAYHDEHIVCSECHSVWNIIDNDTERFDYCPNCGARMKGEADER